VDCLLARGAAGGDELPAVHCAALSNATDCLHTLVGAYPQHLTTPSANGWLPLHVASAAGSLDAVDALLKAGADVEAPTHDGMTALEIACAFGHVAVIEHLLGSNATGVPTCDLPSESMALVCATVGGDVDCMRALMTRGVIAALSPTGIAGVAAAAAWLHGEDCELGTAFS
jgi:hypothetical protein